MRFKDTDEKSRLKKKNARFLVLYVFESTRNLMLNIALIVVLKCNRGCAVLKKGWC